MKLRALLLSLVGITGCLQVAGYALDSPTLRGLGLASGISPFPKVFCEAEGYEPFAATFALSGLDPSGKRVEIPLTPELYSRLSGPYMRRNVYGAALAYAPRLSDELRTSIYAELGQLVEELELPELQELTLIVRPRTGEQTPLYTYPLHPISQP